MRKTLLLHILIPILTAGICPALAEAYPMPSSYSPTSGEPLEGMSFLYNGFLHPQDTARTKVWWFHGETEGTHQGITADLEAFRQAGVGGVVYYNQVHGNGEGAAQVFSPEWWDEIVFSAQEAQRLGLSFEVNASNGYVAGGKWITPDKSMQRLNSHEMLLNSKGGDVQFSLPATKTPGGWQKTVAVYALPYDPDLMADSRSVFSQDSVMRLDDPSQTAYMVIDFGKSFTARSITYVTGGRGKARTSSMQVPKSHFLAHPDNGIYREGEFFGCGFRLLPDIGELEVSDNGIDYRTVCSLRPKYKNHGGGKEQTIAFPTTKGRYFRIRLHDWGSGMKSDDRLTFGNVTISARASVDVWQEKASLISELMEPDRTPSYTKEDIIDFSKAIDLTSCTDDEGRVTWQGAPRGQWLILRLFAASTGGHTKHGRKEALGLECDKLSTDGARLQWQSYVKPIIDTLHAHAPASLSGICMDSHEAGPQNWTLRMPQEFQKAQGYDITTFLPVMAGYVVGSAEESNKFLYDLRHTINSLITDRYYGEFNRLCRAEGLTLTAQAIGGALCMAGDAVSVKKLVDKPQAEFWGYQTEGSYDIKDCSSAAHLYGKQIASGEAFTDITYRHTLADIKNLADYAYAYGINELVVCAVAYQPWVRQAGEQLRISTANGRQYVLNRLNTLWPLSKPFWDYQARCSWMLRQGKPVSDICYYLGDDIPARILSHKLPDIPQGYDYDAFTTDALLSRMSASDGRITLPDGVSYRMMILPTDGSQLPPAAREKIEAFRKAGIPIYDPQTDSRSLEQALQEAGLRPDVESPARDKTLYSCHRRTANEDIYFLNNHSDQDVSGSFRFNVSAASAELWNPVTGERTSLLPQHSPLNTPAFSTALNLTLHARESYFIILSDTLRPGVCNSIAGTKTPTEEVPLTQPWTATFDTEMGGPAEPVIIDNDTCRHRSLQFFAAQNATGTGHSAGVLDWTLASDPRIKYYSGTVKLTSTFKLKTDKTANYRLSLPLMGSAAEVIINGQSAGIVWCSPWETDITGLLRSGKNTIELRIANTLWNRLVGDARLPEAQRISWQTNPLAKPDDTLVPSGLSAQPTIHILRSKPSPTR
ncbi:MAG: glycosyl hydrolase family 2 [Prevotella sp.]|nr:glycosyl hydrolase family 2 [Prevotella sp.]